MNLKLSRKSKENLKKFFLETGKGLKATGKGILKYSEPASRGFGKSAEMIEESFANPRRFEPLPQGGFIEKRPLNPKAFYPRPMPTRKGYLDLRPKPRMRRNPFEMI